MCICSESVDDDDDDDDGDYVALSDVSVEEVFYKWVPPIPPSFFGCEPAPSRAASANGGFHT